MKFPRASGVLLHPTSLPSPYGIGDLGAMAYRFVDYLESAGQTVWQILPLGPTSYGDSPYQTLSALAGNPLLISLDRLVADGWLTPVDLAGMPNFSIYAVEYGEVITYHDKMLSIAYKRFRERADATTRGKFEAWCAENAFWLDDFALFMVLKASHGGRPWVEWPEGEVLRKPDVIGAAKVTYKDQIEGQKFRQWLFQTHWLDVKRYANSKGIRLVGDIPIFVAHDSSDVWSNPELFYLDTLGHPTVVAGVPPDYFSETGQRWGNPLYRWDIMDSTRYVWWIQRFRETLKLVDIVRVDHFRGFEAYWEIPASEPTAVKGKWLPGPGAKLFKAVLPALGDLPIIAEDLGVITPGVEALRDGFGLPGMKVLQFAFSWDPYGENAFLPHNYTPNCVVYSGTHDNNTTLGWWQNGEATKEARDLLEAYVGHPIAEPNWEFIRLGMASVGNTFVAPLQDVLGFGADTRMNTPGRPAGNWTWRFEAKWLDHHSRERLVFLTKLFNRWPEDRKPKKEATPDVLSNDLSDRK